MTTALQSKRRLPIQPRAKASTEIGRALQHATGQLSHAAQGQLSAKSLHDLRVACRRAESALRLCRDAADGRAWRWLKRHLKSLRRACNTARDYDVLGEWVRRQGASSSKSLRQAIRDHRAEVEPKIVKLARRVSDRQCFERQSQIVVKRLRVAELKGQVAAAFGRRLFADVSRFVKALPARHDDASALHRLRIIGKRLRYASELVTAIWPDVALRELNEHLHALQDRLGAIHDQIVGARCLRKLLRTRAIRTLVGKAQATAARLQRRFWRWWKTVPLERMLADTTAEVVTLICQLT